MENSRNSPRTYVLFGLVGAVSFFSGGWLLQRAEGDRQGYERAALFRQVVQRVADYYVDDVTEDQLYDIAIDGMLGQLNDPYTTFLRSEDFDNLQLSTTGNYGGLGIRIEVRDRAITVITPLPDTPAERAGIVSGDRIVAVEGESTRDWNSETAVARLTGEAGSSVRITVERPGYSEPLEFEITRDRIHVNSVGATVMVTPTIGYVQLTTIAETSAEEVERAIAQLRDRGARSLIFDLRSNPGGLLEQGVGLADLFLPRAAVVVETRGRGPGSNRIYRANLDARWPEMPLVVLVNEFSASAAEIVAGALQDHDRALLVGRTTFGKGVAQLVFRIGQRQALKVTNSRWYTPVGRSINIDRRNAHDSTATADSASSSDDAVFQTSSGRILPGGGGIHPDVEVPADTLTDAERVFARVLGGNIQTYRDVLTSTALAMKAGGDQIDSNFVVTPSMRAGLLAEIRERGVEISDADWQGASDLVSQQFRYEVSRYVFSRQVEMRRRVSEDTDVQRAVELLSGASDQQALFAVPAGEN